LLEKNKYVLDDETSDYVKKLLEDMYENRGANFGNARDVRNIFEKVVSAQANRVAALNVPTKKDLVTIRKEDFKDM